MRELKEIENEIKQFEEQRRVIDGKIGLLRVEQAERKFADFCEKYNMKLGDIVKTESYGIVQICGISKSIGNWIVCRKIKNNGEPYQSFVQHMEESFKGCEFVRHIDVENVTIL